MILLLLLYAACVVLGWDYAPSSPVQEAFWAALIMLIGSLFANVGRIVMDVIRAIGPIFQAVWNGINVVIRTIGENAGRFFRTIANGLRSVWDGVIKPVVDAVWKVIDKFKQFLDRVFAPIRAAFEWVTKLLDTIWTKVIAPILDAIEKIRAVLRILAELGVPFAARLEQILQTIESAIFNAFREVVNWVNTVSSWFDLLLDPRGWIRSTPFLMTVWKFGGNIVNLLVALGADVRHQVIIDDYRASHPTRATSQVTADLRAGVYRDRGYAQQAFARLRSTRRGV